MRKMGEQQRGGATTRGGGGGAPDYAQLRRQALPRPAGQRVGQQLAPEAEVEIRDAGNRKAGLEGPELGDRQERAAAQPPPQRGRDAADEGKAAVDVGARQHQALSERGARPCSARRDSARQQGGR